ncbi:outer membrane beta-barrel protein [Duganella sp. FT80W]|uniref:Outer membrane beta-barrel protein n=1 Tax=Duganella guangzhouensis TaxID=2666084 RepID=A0A6I2KZL6_9BURK|nr:outer membrane beta-barrel protein [Duganella guangzhouensis]MRW90990.1 outer membrane beta-barrel protein [Duganella guangzhouensis]
MNKSLGWLLLLIAGAARAEEPSIYSLGADLGLNTRYKLKCWSGIGCDQRAERGLRLYTAYTLGSNQLLGLRNSNALELSAFDFGNVTSVVQTAADGGHLPGKSKVVGASLNYVSGLQLSERLALTTKAGVSFARSTVQYADAFDLSNYGAVGTTRSNRVGLDYGLGFAYALDKNWSLHGDWLRVPIKLGTYDKTHVDMYSIGLGYRF